MELSNDEVYYWTYGLYPDISHFDHPPMVGYIIRLFTFNLSFDSELFIRLGAVVMSAINTYMAFKIGVQLRNEQTGYFAALLYTASIYASILAGTFIIPDSPQLFFWMLALWLYLSAFTSDHTKKKEWRLFIGAGLCSAAAILSKYHSIFIPAGIILYVCCFDQKWLKHPAFYVSLLIAAAGILPILIWNMQNDFISFTFHGDRVAPVWHMRPDYFFREIGGQVAYNNPVNFFMIIMAFSSMLRGRPFLPKKLTGLLLLNGLPLILTFTGIALFRETLPHWSGPGYLPLIFVAACYLNARYEDKTVKIQWTGTPRGLKYSVYLILFFLVVAVWLINYSPINFGKHTPKEKLGEDDFTQDMYGWQQLAYQFDSLKQHRKLPHQDFIAQKWFPGTHIHYYVARPHNANMYMIGSLKDIHKYAWINMAEGGLKEGNNYYHITSTTNSRHPIAHLSPYFESVIVIDTMEVRRSGKLMRYGILLDCQNYKGNYQNPL